MFARILRRVRPAAIVLLLILAGCGNPATTPTTSSPTAFAAQQVVATAATPATANATPLSTPTNVPTSAPTSTPQQTPTNTPMATAKPATPTRATPTFAAPTARTASATAASASPTAIAALTGAGTITYIGTLGSKSGIIVTNADGTGRTLLAEGDYDSLLWSPDGSRFAAVTTLDILGGKQTLVIFDATGKELGREQFAGTVVPSQLWSPDSQSLLGSSLTYDFTSSQPSRAITSWLWSAGKLQTIPLPPEEFPAMYYWLPDGRVLVSSFLFAASPSPSTNPADPNGTGTTDVINTWLYSPDSGAITKIMEGQKLPLGLADKSGEIINYAIEYSAPNTFGESWIERFDLSNGQARTIVRASELAQRVLPSAAQGTRFIIASASTFESDAPPVAPQTAYLALYLGEMKGSATIDGMITRALVIIDQQGNVIYSELLPADDERGSLVWSPDGTRLAYHQDNELRIINVLAKTTQSFTVPVFPVSPTISWAPDSRWLIRSSAQSMTIIDVQGNRDFPFRAYGEKPAWRPTPAP